MLLVLVLVLVHDPCVSGIVRIGKVAHAQREKDDGHHSRHTKQRSLPAFLRLQRALQLPRAHDQTHPDQFAHYGAQWQGLHWMVVLD